MRHRSAPSARHTFAAIPDRAREATPAPGTALHIKIGRLTIQGYSSAEQKRFTSALQSSLSELARRSGGQLSAAKALRMNRLDAGRLSAGATPEAAARQIATRLFARLAQAQTTRRTTRHSGEENHA